jgi:hypothetical protein
MADDLINVIDENGKKHRISAAQRNRWPSVAASFRLAPAKATPVVKKVTPVTEQPPTGEKTKEN